VGTTVRELKEKVQLNINNMERKRGNKKKGAPFISGIFGMGGMFGSRKIKQHEKAHEKMGINGDNSKKPIINKKKEVDLRDGQPTPPPPPGKQPDNKKEE